MTVSQEQHLERIKARFDAAVDAKYRAGAAEHGGTLLDADALTLIAWAKQEAVDQWVYLDTLEEQIRCRAQESKSARTS